MFTKAIVRTPGKSLVNGITTANLGLPNYSLALEQHRNYINALQKCGLEVIVMEADEDFPDSTFIEDTALLTPKCAVVMRPGAKSRQGEPEALIELLENHYQNIEIIKAPGTIEGGDIMMVGDHYFVGISQRTNEAGANQLINILNNYGMSGSTIKLKELLHLKTGLAYLENNNLVIAGEFIDSLEFSKFNQIKISTEESYAANCIWVNNKVIIPEGFPKTKNSVKTFGYKILTVNVSEFQKLDGGLSCLSLRF